VAYDLQLSDYWQNYLENLPVSDNAKDKLSDFLEYGIASVSDSFRNDPDNRPWPDKPYFRRTFFILDTDTSGSLVNHLIDFVVQDDTAPYGVLVIVWIDQLL
jgi:hypothetical protein